MPRDLGALAHWHLNYETVECHPAATFRVTKMKFAKSKDPATGKGINDKTTVIYNSWNAKRGCSAAQVDASMQCLLGIV